MKEIVTKNAPAAIGPYAQGYVTKDFVFTSGQLGVDPQQEKHLMELQRKLNGLVKMSVLF